MAEEFKGDMPEIKIMTPSGWGFFYECVETGKTLGLPCSRYNPRSDKCFDCIGFNIRFAKYFEDNRYCSCGYKVDFGYFIIIFHFDKAGLLPKDFKMQCCNCYHKEQHPTCGMCEIDGT